MLSLQVEVTILPTDFVTVPFKERFRLGAQRKKIFNKIFNVVETLKFVK